MCDAAIEVGITYSRLLDWSVLLMPLYAAYVGSLPEPLSSYPPDMLSLQI